MYEIEVLQGCDTFFWEGDFYNHIDASKPDQMEATIGIFTALSFFTYFSPTVRLGSLDILNFRHHYSSLLSLNVSATTSSEP